MNTVAAARSTAGLARWAALGGIVYVVLFVIGIIVMFNGEPNGDASPARVIAYYSDSGHRNKIMFGWLIAWLGIVAGILALDSIIFFPQAAIGLWILIVSGLLFARGARDVPTQAEAVPR